MSIAPPACRHRGLECGHERWTCGSPKLVIPGGIVSSRDCSEVCPFVDHPHDDDLIADRYTAHDFPREIIPAGREAPEDVAIAVITAHRPVPTIERTIRELRRAGFSQAVRVFAEPGSSIPDLPGLIAVPAARPLGAWQNWMRAARTLLGETDSPHLLICEDDIGLAPCARLALDHAIRTLPREDWGYVSLYTPGHHLTESVTSEVEGWRAIDLVDREYWGALAYCFTRDSLSEAIRSSMVLEHQGDRDVDTIVSRALRSSGRRLYFHVPSLAEHTGRGISSLGHAPLLGSLAAGFSAAYDRYMAGSPGGLIGSTIAEGDDASVTVVVATYNCAEYLPGCLRSLLGQTVPCRIVVVDDGSRDATREVLRQFEGAVRVLTHEENRGSRAARASGLREARSEWVVMADADAIYSPDYLETLLAAADDRTSVVYCSWERLVPGAAASEAEIIHAHPFDAEGLWWANGISMSSLVRREVVPESIGQSDDLDDWALWLDLASRDCRFRSVDRVLFRAFERPEGKTKGLRDDSERYLREVARLRRLYSGLIGVDGRISVIIPAKECLDLTERCLRHLAWYAGLPIEVIYVDNGSDPEVPARVAALGESLGLPLATIRNSSNRHFTAAVNQGLRFAEGRHVLCLNNDCFLGPDCLERLYWHLIGSGDRVAAVGPLTGDGEGQSIRQPWRRAQAGIPAGWDVDYDDPVAGALSVRGPSRAQAEDMVAFFCTLLNRDALRECGPLDERTPVFESGLGADDEWCLRASRRGWSVLLALDAYAAHLGHQSFRRLEIDRDSLQASALAAFERIAGPAPATAFGAGHDRAVGDC